MTILWWNLSIRVYEITVKMLEICFKKVFLRTKTKAVTEPHHCLFSILLFSLDNVAVTVVERM